MSIAFCVRRILVAGSCALWATSPAPAQYSVDAFNRSGKTPLIIGATASSDDIGSRLIASHRAEAALALSAEAKR